MPLFNRKSFKSDLETLVWKISESEEELLQSVVLHPSDQQKLSGINHPLKRLEFLALRQCLIAFFGDNPEVFYTENGKPFVKNDHFISFSHTRGYAAMAISPSREVGIDIEVYRPGILRVREKFMHEEEKKSLEPETEIEQLTYFWGAKESIVKIEGDRRLDFKGELRVAGFGIKDLKGTQARWSKSENTTTYDIFFDRQDDLFLTCGHRSD